MVSRAVGPLSLFLTRARGKRKKANERHSARRTQTGSPAAHGAIPDSRSEPLEQMGSISYFVTPPFHRAVSFSRAPTHLAIYFAVIYISRLNAPPPLGAYNARALSLVRSLSAPTPRACRFLPASGRNNATKWSLPGLFIGWQITRVRFDHCRAGN